MNERVRESEKGREQERKLQGGAQQELIMAGRKWS